VTFLRRYFSNGLWIESAFALITAGGLIWAMTFLYFNGYLPQPYFYDPNDAWMDWFNTADWARDAGAYDSWGTVYAPLTFVFLKLVGISSCYQGGSGYSTSYYARECDWVGVLMIHAIYILNVIIIARTYLKTDRRTALPRAFALAVSLPLTMSLERGNIVLLAFTCLMLAHGPLVKSARLRWLAMGFAINFKIYMVASLVPYLLQRRWRWFEGAVFATIAIYVLTFLIYGRGAPGEIYQNVIAFQDGQAFDLLDVWFTATYAPLLTLLNNPAIPINATIGSWLVNLMINVFSGALIVVQVSIVLAAIAIWLRPEAVPRYRAINLGLSLALVTVESSGYTQTFIMFLAFFEKWKGAGAKWAIIASYLLCIQFDFPVDQAATAVRDTFYDSSTKIVTYYIMTGPFFRPGLFYSIPLALSCATLHAVWLDVRRQGWKSRWRFRNDLPLLHGAGGIEKPL
jgi:hypothetical protein